jgi:hypothetical protein
MIFLIHDCKAMKISITQFLLIVLLSVSIAQTDNNPVTSRWVTVDQTARPIHEPYNAEKAMYQLQNIQPLKKYNKGNRRICVIVDADVYTDIENTLDVFVQGLAADGYSVLVSTFGSGTAENLRLYLTTLYQSEESLEGAILIGNLPYVIYEMMQTWEDNNSRYAPAFEDFVCDLYFMDLDGVWEDSRNEGMLGANNNKLDTHSGDRSLEIWVSRIKTDNLPLIGRETDLLNTYFLKNDHYRKIKNFPHKVLIYNDDDWSILAGGDKDNFSQIYPENQIVTVNHSEETNRTNYIQNHLLQPYELVHIRAHGNSQAHVFYQNGQTLYNSVDVSDYVENDPQVFFYSLYICSSSDFIQSNNLANILTFNPDSPTLLSWGSSKTGGLYKEKKLYKYLGDGENFGTAFRLWFNETIKRFPEESPQWIYGMILSGDATLNPLYLHDFQEKELFSDSPVLDFKDIRSLDLDANGKMDIMTTGSNHSNSYAIRTYLALNNQTFISMPNHIIPPTRGCAALADINGDGLEDLMISGLYTDGYKTLIYINNSEQNQFSGFTKIDPGIKGVTNGCISAEDIDNDGDIDIFICGLYKETPATFVYLNTSSESYSLTFEEMESGIDGLVYGESAWLDIDGDLDKDLFLTGSDLSDNGSVRFYINTLRETSGDKAFTAAQINFDAMRFAKFAWQDYDRDGDADLAIMGQSEHGPRVLLYRNQLLNQSAGFSRNDFADYAGGDIAWNDYDNDGFPDLFITGEHVPRQYFSNIYRNKSANEWEKTFAPHGVNGGLFSFLDADHDTKCDFVLVGKGGINKIYFNKTAENNNPPDPPTRLQAQVLGESVTFTWQAPHDDKTPKQSLNYNLRVGTTPESADIYSPGTAFSDHSLPGNINLNTQWRLYLDPGEYYWSVQAIDGAGAVSEYAPVKKFEIIDQQVVYLKLSLFLEGFFDQEEKKMKTAFSRNKMLPAEAPHQSLRLELEEVTDHIIDWISIGFIRNGSVSTCDFLLDQNGNVLSPETLTSYLQPDLDPGTYDIVIRHRNHLPCELFSITLSNNVLRQIDLRYVPENVRTKNNIKCLGENLWALRAGDANQDGILNLNDYSSWFRAALKEQPNYVPEDYNGDGMVTTRDYLLWHNNYIHISSH